MRSGLSAHFVRIVDGIINGAAHKERQKQRDTVDNDEEKDWVKGTYA